MKTHIPVLAKEVVDQLCITESGTYVDLTMGRAGHSLLILENLKTGLLLAFDKDADAIKESGPILDNVGNKFKVIHSDFKNIKAELSKLELTKVDGILADLGVSSPQLDQAHRGFSYNKEARPDMRMDQTQLLDAYQVINEWDVEDISRILKQYADVKSGWRIANAIKDSRPIETTTHLTQVIRDCLPAAVVRKKNMARPVFQAIRIAVNNELGALEQMLDDAVDMLNINGKLAIITFHSIEDRIVKRKFQGLCENKTGKLPIMEEKKFSFKTTKPSKAEVELNPRSRSARLRVLTKLG